MSCDEKRFEGVRSRESADLPYGVERRVFALANETRPIGGRTLRAVLEHFAAYALDEGADFDADDVQTPSLLRAESLRESSR